MAKKHIRIIFIICSFFVIPFSLYSLNLDETINTLSGVSKNESVQFMWDPLLQNGVFNLGDYFGTFSTASAKGETGFLVFNNRELFNVPLPYNDNGKLEFPENFVITLKDAFAKSFDNDSSRFHISTIIIDPGHGGKDPGAISRQTINGKTVQLSEKDIVLKSGQILRDLLNQTYPEKKVIMTRDTDVYLTLDQRSEMANAVTVKDNEAVIFISIHANWSANAAARGYEVWHITSNYRRSLLDSSKHNYSPDISAILNAMMEEEFTTESIILANSILSGLGKEFGGSVPSRGRKAENWFVVRNSRMPAVLVELGFVSNHNDAVLMTSDEGLQKLTAALYNGVKNFISIFEH